MRNGAMKFVLHNVYHSDLKYKKKSTYLAQI